MNFKDFKGLADKKKDRKFSGPIDFKLQLVDWKKLIVSWRNIHFIILEARIFILDKKYKTAYHLYD
mgnify:CR=1 FL=1